MTKHTLSASRKRLAAYITLPLLVLYMVFVFSDFTFEIEYVYDLFFIPMFCTFICSPFVVLFFLLRFTLEHARKAVDWILVALTVITLAGIPLYYSFLWYFDINQTASSNSTAGVLWIIIPPIALIISVPLTALQTVMILGRKRDNSYISTSK